MFLLFELKKHVIIISLWRDKMEYLFIDNNLPKPLNKNVINDYFMNLPMDSSYRTKIIYHNIRFVISIVNNKFVTTNYSKAELVELGIIGLIKSVDTFDYTKNINFLTYASTCIENEILMFLRSDKKNQNIESLEKKFIFDDEEISLEELNSDKMISDIDIIGDYEEKELYTIIDDIVTKLPSVKRIIVEKYFGFYDNKPVRQQEIANYLNLSQSYVSRVLKKTLKEIKNELIKEKLFEIKTKNKTK